MKHVKIIFSLACGFATIASSIALAQTRCVTPRNGRSVCSKFPGGGAALGSDGKARCGVGECVVADGYVKCSDSVGGGAVVDANDYARCGVGECVVSDGYAYCSTTPGGWATVSGGHPRCHGSCTHASHCGFVTFANCE